jgi:hypothetical protein
LTIVPSLWVDLATPGLDYRRTVVRIVGFGFGLTAQCALADLSAKRKNNASLHFSLNEPLGLHFISDATEPFLAPPSGLRPRGDVLLGSEFRPSPSHFHYQETGIE